MCIVVCMYEGECVYIYIHALHTCMHHDHDIHACIRTYIHSHIIIGIGQKVVIQIITTM